MTLKTDDDSSNLNRIYCPDVASEDIGKNDHADHEAASQALPQAADEVLAHLLCAGVEAPKPRSDTFARHRATFETAHGVLLSMRHASNLGI